MMGQLANDLLLCMVVTQVIMHYQYLAKRIAAYETATFCKNVSGSGSVCAGSYDRDMEFLKFIIKYHQRVLR